MDGPELSIGDSFYLQSFRDLNTCRQIGMSLGPIPWTAMIQYADRFGLDEDLIDDFIYIMRIMDEAYIEHSNKKKDG